MEISGKLVFDLIAASKEMVRNCKGCGGNGDVYSGDPEFDPSDCWFCSKLRNVLKEVQKELSHQLTKPKSVL